MQHQLPLQKTVQVLKPVGVHQLKLSTFEITLYQFHKD